ncbi:MAG: molybdenum cofactor guanylyltransferase [Thermomonas sp.]|uniref:molybdenum cofactor guanylyltransferase n=1 Tax=Thermomonas sp. TaxID=1971895 RepID=UPI001EC09402|nr:molybdenum cofactor guanylyltransferase [Thermomonas sp.]MBV2209382.1 molybdenum cofactor guanylyltransferase [Thermomonas sp.]
MTTPEPMWTGLVLAGGRSSRMGQDKAALLWQGKPLLQHMQALLHAAGAQRVVVSGNYPEENGIPDLISELGPLGGLTSVASALPDGPLLIVPVDMPQLTPELLTTLAQRPEHCLCYAEHMLPMRLQLDATSRQFLSTCAQRPPRERSLHALHAALQGQFLAIPEGALAQLHNVNTPEQWQEATA